MRVRLVGVVVVAGVMAVCALGWGVVSAGAVETGGAPVGSSGSLLVSQFSAAQAEQEAREALLQSPAAVAERLASRTEFEGLGPAAAVALAKRVFGVGGPRWVAPQSVAQGRITGYVGADAVREVLPDGRHALIQSSLPLRSDVGSGSLAPVSLSLKASGSVYAPANPLVPVQISSQAAGGVSLPDGIRVTPVRHESTLPGELVGSSVFFSGSASDTDLIVEPLPAGVAFSWQLRSQESPEGNSLHFSLPAGASLLLSKSVPEAAEVWSAPCCC